MRKITIILMIFGICLIISRCNLYPSKSKWKKSDTIIGDSIKFNHNDLFQLRITESLVLPKANDKDTDIQLQEGDIPYRKFEQYTEEETTNRNKNIVEEAYLYLENYSNKKSDSGRALYFITYPIIYRKKWKDTYNDDKDKFLNLSREIQVGFWEKDSIKVVSTKVDSTKETTFKGYKIKLAFKESDHDVYLLKGCGYADSIGIRSLSHTVPNELRKDLKTKDNIQFDLISEQLAYIELKDVLNLGVKKEELMFSKVPKENRLVIRRKIDRKEWREMKMQLLDTLKRSDWKQLKKESGRKLKYITDVVNSFSIFYCVYFHEKERAKDDMVEEKITIKNIYIETTRDTAEFPSIIKNDTCNEKKVDIIPQKNQDIIIECEPCKENEIIIKRYLNEKQKYKYKQKNVHMLFTKSKDTPPKKKRISECLKEE